MVRVGRHRGGEDVAGPGGVAVWLVLFMVACYRSAIRPLLVGSCRFTPSCSEYAAQAVHRHGVWHGGLLAVGRLARCNPLHQGGWDPVPESLRR
jgi:uncharacterized protein